MTRTDHAALYLEALESELAQAGVPRRRRARILAEFRDHLAENPQAQLGAPAALARQFADELGTRLARTTAYRAFVVLALTATFLAVMFLTGGRQHGWIGNGHYGDGLVAVWWWVPLQLVCFLSAQTALASGLLALLRALRLRNAATMAAAEAQILNRRTAVAVVCGAVTMTVLPLTEGSTSLAYTQYSWWYGAARWGGIAASVILLALLPDLLRAARIRPSLTGTAGDLTSDLGMAGLPRITPARLSAALALTIFVALALVGVAADDPIDGALRGIADAGACLAGFAVLGRYLGLRAAPTDPDNSLAQPRSTNG